MNGVYVELSLESSRERLWLKQSHLHLYQIARLMSFGGCVSGQLSLQPWLGYQHRFPYWASTDNRIYDNQLFVRDQSFCDSFKGKYDVMVESDKLLDRTSPLSCARK